MHMDNSHIDLLVKILLVYSDEKVSNEKKFG